MKILLGLVAAIVCLGSVTATAEEAVVAKEAVVLDSQVQKLSYGFGLQLGKNFKQGEIEVDVDILARGIKDFMSGAEPLMTEEQVQQTMAAFQEEMMKKSQERQKELAEKNKTAGDAFLAENKQKEGVVTLESGLQYKVLTEGTGATPTEKDTVSVNYEGKLLDGKVFDSSYKRGQPAEFGVAGVIKGWTEALQLMKIGSKWELYVPASLAYGERGNRGIGPNETLIFDVELLGIKSESADEPAEK